MHYHRREAATLTRRDFDYAWVRGYVASTLVIICLLLFYVVAVRRRQRGRHSEKMRFAWCAFLCVAFGRIVQLVHFACTLIRGQRNASCKSLSV